MKTVLTEKPSVALEIAKVLGAEHRKDGYFEGNGYYVTWTSGHLLMWGMPKDYGINTVNARSLPFFPEDFLLTVRHQRKGNTYKEDPNARRQLNIIATLFDKCDSIIVATDAGGEGELIFRFIYQYLNCVKPFERLWISSLTKSAIKAGFENLKPGYDFNRLFLAGKSRSQADWLVGINASHALSVSAGNEIYSLGRVQTPTLKLICEHYIRHNDFESKPYWQIKLQHERSGTIFHSLSKIRFVDKMAAEDLLSSAMRRKTVSVENIELKTVRENPPLLFDLTGLQKEANNRWRFSAQQTLDIAQRLYENKFITYPRTGSKYIPEDLWPTISTLIRGLSIRNQWKNKVEDLKFRRFNKQMVNKLKITDHHGILVTEKVPSSLTAEEDKIYDLIAGRLLESISQAYIKEVTLFHLNLLQYEFIAKGTRIKEMGWRNIIDDIENEQDEPGQILPEIIKGTNLTIENAQILCKKTKAPELLTEATVLGAMENAGKKVENKDQHEILRNIGIGTPATRASIIETLFKRNYICRKQKYIVPTSKGMQTYEWTKDKKISNVEMTAEWEISFADIEENNTDLTHFYKNIAHYLCEITSELLNLKITKEPTQPLCCPICRTSTVVVRDKVIRCSNNECDWILWRNICGLTLGIKDIELLLSSRKTSLLKGMKSKTGTLFNAYLVLNNLGGTSFEFENRK